MQGQDPNCRRSTREAGCPFPAGRSPEPTLDRVRDASPTRGTECLGFRSEPASERIHATQRE